jgi:hypothetical protein
MLKKCNSICSWILILCLLGHLFTMSYSMLTGWYDYTICKALAKSTAAVTAIHVLLSLILLFFFHDGGQLTKYPKQNIKTILQRASGIVIICLLHKHVKDFGFIVTGATLSGLDKVLLLTSEILFFGAIFIHLATSFSRSLITIGLISTDEMEGRVNHVITIACIILMTLTTFALTRYVILWAGY